MDLVPARARFLSESSQKEEIVPFGILQRLGEDNGSVTSLWCVMSLFGCQPMDASSSFCRKYVTQARMCFRLHMPTVIVPNP